MEAYNKGTRASLLELKCCMKSVSRDEAALGRSGQFDCPNTAGVFALPGL